jgi:hypothetical protein
LYIYFLHFCLTSNLHVTLHFFIFSASFFLCLYCFCVHICLSLPSTLLLYHYALFFVVFPSLAPRIKFSFLLCFIAFFCHLPSFVFLSPRLLFLPRFVPCVLFMPFFLLVFIPYGLSSLSNFTFSPLLLYCSPPTIQCFLLSSPFFFRYIILLAIFSLDDSQETQTYTLYTLRRDICKPVMQTFWREVTTAK